MAITEDGKLAASVSEGKGNLMFWDLTSGQPVMRMSGDKLSDVRTAAAFNPFSTLTQRPRTRSLQSNFDLGPRLKEERWHLVAGTQDVSSCSFVSIVNVQIWAALTIYLTPGLQTSVTYRLSSSK